MSTATEVGGDYYDFYKTEDNTVTIAIGDATGHGVMAGIMVTAVKSLFNLLAPDTGLLDILCRSTKTIRKMGMKNLFMALGLLRIKDYVLETAGAGMPPVYIFHSATGEVESIPLKGLPLGIAKGDEYTNTFTEVAPGDIIVVMSDGFPEMFNRQKENLGYEKIPLMLKESGRKSPKQIIKDFKDAAADWAGGISQQDDMTFVVIKVS
jgi:serine phosphatase RsbU (regulator of sigma subunit)